MFNKSGMRKVELEPDAENTEELEVDRGLSIIRASGLKLNRNDTRFIRELLNDLTRRNNSRASDILDLPTIVEVLSHDKLNGPQKLTKLKRALFELRYPILTQAEDSFDAEVKDANLHPRIKIGHTPYFEDNAIEVRFKYDNPAQLREMIRSLERLADRDPVKNALAAAEDSC